jgi:crotonobetainyl-CoA:carnitine CoA-transferase CaiB-like acyl-CoA transferase
VLEEHSYLKTLRAAAPRRRSAPARSRSGEADPDEGRLDLHLRQHRREAFAFFAAIGRPELKHDPRFANVQVRFANVGEYFKLRADALQAKTTAEWIGILDRHDVPAMPYQTLDGLLDDPHLADAGFFELKDHPTEGKIRSMRLPNKWSSGTRREWRPAPKLGQDSVEVLREVGYSAAEVERLIAAGVTVDGRLERAAPTRERRAVDPAPSIRRRRRREARPRAA